MNNDKVRLVLVDTGAELALGEARSRGVSEHLLDLARPLLSDEATQYKAAEILGGLRYPSLQAEASAEIDLAVLANEMTSIDLADSVRGGRSNIIDFGADDDANATALAEEWTRQYPTHGSW